MGGDDCDDTDPDTFPGAAEAESSTACMTDADGDGWGSDDPTPGVTAGADCDDARGSVNPGASDGVFGDRSCDGEGGSGDLAAAEVILDGELERDRAGRWAHGIGDVDGDGLDDVLVGAFGYDDDRGRVYILLGKNLASGLLSGADHVLVGEEVGDKAGWTAASGDLDGDGTPDVAVGAPGASAVYVVYGASLGSMDLGDADVVIRGEAGQELGRSVAVGDVDGDGRDDLVVGAAGGAGLVAVFDGATLGSAASLADADSTLVGDAEGDEVGRTLALGDVDADGTQDLVIGGATESFANSSDRGTVHVVLASGLVPGETSLTGVWDHVMLEQDGKDDFAAALATLDVDGDGHADILIGGGDSWSGSGHAGIAYLFLASSLGGDALSASTADHWFGGVHTDSNAAGAPGSVGSVGDLDGDGLDDVLIGANGATSSEGAAHIVLAASLPGGQVHLLDADHTLTGAVGDGELGLRVTTAGDVNGDGSTDLLIGMMGADHTASTAGRVYIVHGP
ncbi:MAG: hypothetical protein GY884_35755 [Proteobacteria bacterium]|nr:hypothetical protein [Pseudomonadota bacterium]